MILTIPEKKIIRTIKAVQKDLNSYVVFSNDFKNIYSYDDWSMNSIQRAMSSSPNASIKFDSTTVQFALKKLVSIGYIQTVGNSPALQLTYEGWYCSYISKIELLHATINNIFIPNVVSVITTLITIWITSHV